MNEHTTKRSFRKDVEAKENSKYTTLLFQRHKMKRRKAALVAMIAEEESSTAEQRDAKIVTSTGQIF